MKNKTYPPAVEENLQIVVEASKDLDFDFKLREDCVREVFGELFLNQWLLEGNVEIELCEDEVLDLYKKAGAMSILEDMKDAGLIDVMEADDDDIIFVTDKGKNIIQ